MKIKKSRVMIVLWIGFFGYVFEGWAGAFSFMMCFLLATAVFYIFVDIFHEIAAFFRGGDTHIHIHQAPESTTPQGHPDIEGTARRHPDPTRPDDEEWAGAITYRLQSGKGWH